MPDTNTSTTFYWILSTCCHRHGEELLPLYTCPARHGRQLDRCGRDKSWAPSFIVFTAVAFTRNVAGALGRRHDAFALTATALASLLFLRALLLGALWLTDPQAFNSAPIRKRGAPSLCPSRCCAPSLVQQSCPCSTRGQPASVGAGARRGLEATCKGLEATCKGLLTSCSELLLCYGSTARDL